MLPMMLTRKTNMTINHLKQYTQINWDPIVFETFKKKYVAKCPACLKPLSEKLFGYDFKPFCKQHEIIIPDLMILEKI